MATWVTNKHWNTRKAQLPIPVCTICEVIWLFICRAYSAALFFTLWFGSCNHCPTGKWCKGKATWTSTSQAEPVSCSLGSQVYFFHNYDGCFDRERGMSFDCHQQKQEAVSSLWVEEQMFPSLSILLHGSVVKELKYRLGYLTNYLLKVSEWGKWSEKCPRFFQMGTSDAIWPLESITSFGGRLIRIAQVWLWPCCVLVSNAP